MNRLRSKVPRGPTREAAGEGDLRAALIDMAVEVLEQVGGYVYPADGILSSWFREHKTGTRERAFIAELVYAVVRRRRTLLRLAGQARSGMSINRQLALLALTRLLGHSTRQLEPLLRRAEVDWLHAVSAHRDEAGSTWPLAERLDLPDWLCERLQAQMPQAELVALMGGLNSPAPLDLRVNTQKSERAPVLASLCAEGIDAQACPYSPLGIRLRHKPALNKHPIFLAGVIEVQDEGSQLLSLLLAPKRGEMVVDFCAGAGGKTLQLGAMMRSTGRLYALDVSDKRLAKLKPRVARAGLSNVHPIVISGENDQRVRRLAGKIDRVLVDAPCSGLGTLRRNPDLKWRQSARAVDELVAKQAAILAAAARLLKPGGQLVYATCSVLAEENQQVVEAFLAAHPEFALRDAGERLAAQGVQGLSLDGPYLQLLPHRHGCDGFFAALMERRKP